MIQAMATPATDASDREIVITRAFDAPRELVFRMFTEPRHVPHWWGPHGFTTTIQEMDVRPGGVWRFIMHGPDGTDYENRVVYHEVVRPERLVYAHGGPEEDAAPNFHVTITFGDQGGGRTQVTLRMLFGTPQARQAMVDFGAVEGGTQTLERLGEYLAAQPA